METLLYLLKVVVASGILFGYYQLFLKDKTFHHYNRFYLMMILPISIFLPLLKVSYFTIQLNPKLFLLLENLNYNPKTESNDFLYFQLVMATLGVVAVFFLVKFLLGVFQIRRFQNQFEKEEYQGINFFNTNLENAPFSFFRNLFWKESILLNSDLGRQILKHEMVHIEQKHSIDKIIIEIVKSIFWFNPFFWLIKKEIHLIHEYLADKKAVQKSDTKAFAEMLLASHFSGKIIPGSSPFLNSNLKKRLQMLQKSNTKYSYLRKILALPLIFILAFAYLVNAKNKEIKATNEMVEKLMETSANKIKRDTIRPLISSKNEKYAQSEKKFDSKNLPTNEDWEKEAEKTESEIGKQLGKSLYNPMMVSLYQATDNNTFIISGKEVSKKEFVKFFIEHEGDENYDFANTGSIYTKLRESGKLAIFAVGKKEEMDFVMQKVVEVVKKYKDVKQPNQETNDIPKQVTENAQILNQKNNKNEFAAFFKNANDERLANAKKKEAKLQQLKTVFLANAEKNKINNNFYKGRDYDKNPLTEEEITALKNEAAEIQMLTEKALQLKNKESFDDRYAFFKTNQVNKVLFDTEGKLVKNENVKLDKIATFPLLVKGLEYYIDGMKVSKEKFTAYKANLKDSESFLKEDSRIKSIRETRVTDGGNYSYAMKYEILTR